jgi:hypothetical protein
MRLWGIKDAMVRKLGGQLGKKTGFSSKKACKYLNHCGMIVSSLKTKVLLGKTVDSRTSLFYTYKLRFIR